MLTYNDPAAIQALIDDIQSAEVDHGPATVAIDLIGGIAGLLQVMPDHRFGRVTFVQATHPLS